MYHIFFIHSFVDGHLDCFHVLAIMKSAAMNIEGTCIFLNYNFIFSGYIPESGIAESCDSSIFSFFFKGASILFSILAAPIYISTNSVGGFPFLYTLSSICYL